VPGLAESWQASRDRRTWLFRIRRGARWSDGQPVTAEDVAATFSRVLEGRSGLRRYLPNVESVEASTARVVAVQLSRPVARLPDIPIPILPRHVWESVGTADLRTFRNDPPIGSGPFRLEETTPDGPIVLRANRAHWGGGPRLAAVEIRFYPDDRRLAAALRRGEVDVADDLSPASYDALGDAEGVTLREAPGLTFVSLGMNTGATRGDGHPALRDAAVRRALARGIDRDAVRVAALGQHGQTGDTIVPPASRFHVSPDEDSLAYDPGQAARELAGQGFRDRDGDGTREGTDRLPLTLRLFSRSAFPETQLVAALVGASLEEIGVRVQVQALADAELARRIRNGTYDLFVWGWAADHDPDVVLSTLTCAERRPRGINDTWFCDEQYDRLYRRQQRAVDRQRRTRMVHRLQLLAYAKAPYVVLYYRPWLQGYRSDRVSGWSPQPPDGPLVFGPGVASYLSVRVAGTRPPAPAAAAVEPPSAGVIADAVDSERLWLLVAGGAVLASTLGWLLLVARSRRVRWREAREQAAADAGDGERLGPGSP
jgi:peptide/nickel transport system substrate-binding protein